jgi:L-methionine (R)-S-oxide reductase
VTAFERVEYNRTREENYELLFRQLQALLEGETNRIANLANASALLYQFLDEVNWAGFYLMEGEELVLGPFQGLPACVRIPLGKGVCGTSAKRKETILVDDVEQFPGHIACDAASRSEIVVPMIHRGEVVGVLDIDSPVLSRFDQVDRVHLERYVEILMKHW